MTQTVLYSSLTWLDVRTSASFKKLTKKAMSFCKRLLKNIRLAFFRLSAAETSKTFTTKNQFVFWQCK